MSKRWLLLATIFLLAACASRKPRESSPPPKQPAASSQRAPVPETSLPQSSRYRNSKDGGPAAPEVDVSKLVEPVPRREPKSRYGNKSPYSVLGKTYTVLPDSTGYSERGIASWYGNKFHGYMTSSLEPYDMYKFTAAHKSLPLPSYVRVTNLDNGKSVVVRVNDRGPFHESRIIDLSYAAAVRIGVWPKGTGLVEVQALDPEHPAAEPSSSSAVTGADGDARIFLQLGAFSDRANAEQVVKKVERAGLGTARIVATRIDDREIHRVRLGPIDSVARADSLVERIESLGLGTPRVAIDD
ncbi:septal ring lytic transglycosylase RlpA family protein [Dokdonella sp.]|uniref:septal ring lytic transglycosylase RlpA family protein n=1 Tax=Dokdonella sp. TaxID=2291710 RepID=UPI00352738CD